MGKDVVAAQAPTPAAGRFLRRQAEEAREMPSRGKAPDIGHQRDQRRRGDHAGVVDRDGLVFGTENLYLTGASVFPRAGFANPTLTIVAPSSIATSKSWLMPIDSSRSRCARTTCP